MTINRFFIDQENIRGKRVIFPKDVSLQISRVLRLKRGDQVMACLEDLSEYLVELDQLIKDEVAGQFIDQSINQNEPKVNVILYQALLPGEKFEMVLQKGTEIGVSRFVPLETKRSLIKKNNFKEQKLERWKKIVKEAAEQSERGIIPEISPVMSFSEALGEAASNGVTLIAWERGGENLAMSLESSSQQIYLFVGPEGGFDSSEISLAEQSGAKLITLGKTILRSETAGIVFPGLALNL